MTKEEAKQLHCGDEVYWTDPDEGLCSRYYNIKAIYWANDDVICIEDEDGSYLECFAHELT
jgi:hypothetical protein